MTIYTSQLTRTLLLIGALLTTCSPALSQQKSESSPWQRPESLKALFESLGLKFDEIQDRQARSDEDIALYLRVLSRLKQLPLGLVQEWAKTPPDLKLLIESPKANRGELYRIKGTLQSLKKIELPPELEARFEVSILYCLSINVSDAPTRFGDSSECIHVLTTYLPQGLKDYKPIETAPPVWASNGITLRPQTRAANVKCDAMFLAISKDQDRKIVGDGYERPVFVASNFAWLPQSLQEGIQLTPSNLALSKANFDIGLLDTIKSEISKRLTAELTEPFHQMLAAQSRVDLSSLKTAPLELGKLISSPNDFVGEAIEFDAVARRVVEIPIENESDRKRLQLDRYFQVDLIIPKPIRTLVKDKEGIEREVQQENFPLTLCTTEPPTGLAIGEDIREPIRAKAFFFKLWAYESKFAKAQAADTMQVSPLFISATLERVPPPELATSSLIWLVCGATGILAAIALWGYLLIRSDDQRERQQKNAIADSIQPVEIPQTSADSQ